MSDFKALIAKIATGAALSRAEAALAFDTMMSGEATPSQIGGFLMGLRVRGETIEEIVAAAETMRGKMVRVTAPADAIDIVGTGGDASHSLNISTLAALIAAGAGVPVAKHGNRALSSRSGAADCLMALGVNIEISPEKIGECIAKAGIGFMFAPAHHPAMKHVGPSRVELGTRTIFNVLGPLSNPAGVRRAMIGVFNGGLVEPIAHVLNNLGNSSAWVAHGSDGLDEITGTGPTAIAELKNGKISLFQVTPQDVGLAPCTLDALKGGDAAYNAMALRAVLDGAQNAYRNVACMNAGAGLVVAGRASSFAEGFGMAQQAIASGAAKARLDRLIAVSNG